MKVFIMGMHRSGTSLVTGILQRCGLHVGTNLLMHAKDNPKGHYEEKRFLNLNNQLLIRNGGSWHSPPHSISYQGLRKPMIEFLGREEWKREFVGWKDPRICLTFPLWHELIQPEKIKIVYTIRPLEEVAQSLVHRDGRTYGMTYRKALELGRYYGRHAHAHSHRKGCSQFVTYFKSYFSERWQVEVEALCEFIGLEQPSPKKMKRIENFITPELRHFKGAS